MPETTTIEQRELLGEQLQRYRYATLMWCLQAVSAANPQISLYRTTERSRGPAEELCYRLTRSLMTLDAGLPPLNELTTVQKFPMVETWRRVAQAAVLGEHDFGAGVGYGRLSNQQCRTVLKDAAEIAQALVVLDMRYEGIRGWSACRERGRLERAAEVCAVFAGYDEQDHTVDLRGWRPPSATIDGGPLPGIAGVLEAEHNMLVHVAQFPNALNIQRVMNGQRILSHEAARRGPDFAPELIEKWLDREQTYQRLINETRNVGGLVGEGAGSRRSRQRSRPPPPRGRRWGDQPRATAGAGQALHPGRRANRLHHRARRIRTPLLPQREGAAHRRRGRPPREPRPGALRPDLCQPSRPTCSESCASNCAL